MNKTIWTAIVVIIVIGGGWYYFSHSKTTPVAEAGPIKIGYTASLTGSLASVGEAGKNGAELAMDEINADKTLKHKYELVIEDDSFDPAKTASAATKLISVDKVDALISAGSGPGNVVAPLAEQNKIPHIGMASDPNVAKGDYNFIDWTQPQEENSKLVAELQRRKVSKLALFTVNQQGFTVLVTDLKQKLEGTGITFTSENTFNTGDHDFKTSLSQAAKKNPDIYLLFAFDPEIGILGKQIKELGIKTPLTAVESFGLTADPSIFEGQWFIDSAVATSGFADKYRAKYNAEVGPTASNAYDAIHLFVKAAEQSTNTGTQLHADMAATLAKTNDYSGAFGPLTVSSDGRFLSQASVKIVRNGKSVLAN